MHKNEDSKSNTDNINYSYLLITLGLVHIKYTGCTLHVNVICMIVTYRIDTIFTEGLRRTSLDCIRTRQYLSNLDTALHVWLSIVHLVNMILVEFPIFPESTQNDVFVLLIFCGDNRSFYRMQKCVAVSRVADCRRHCIAPYVWSDNMITTQFNNG